MFSHNGSYGGIPIVDSATPPQRRAHAKAPAARCWLRRALQTMAGSKASHCARGAGDGVCDAPLLYFNLAFRLTSSTSYRCVKFKFSTIFDGWLGSRVVSMLDSGAVGPGFKSQPRRCRVTVLSNCSHPSCLCSPSSEIGSSPPKGCDGNCGPGGK